MPLDFQLPPTHGILVIFAPKGDLICILEQSARCAKEIDCVLVTVSRALHCAADGGGAQPAAFSRGCCRFACNKGVNGAHQEVVSAASLKSATAHTRVMCAALLVANGVCRKNSGLALCVCEQSDGKLPQLALTAFYEHEERLFFID